MWTNKWLSLRWWQASDLHKGKRNVVKSPEIPKMNASSRVTSSPPEDNIGVPVVGAQWPLLVWIKYLEISSINEFWSTTIIFFWNLLQFLILKNSLLYYYETFQVKETTNIIITEQKELNNILIKKLILLVIARIACHGIKAVTKKQPFWKYL